MKHLYATITQLFQDRPHEHRRGSVLAFAMVMIVVLVSVVVHFTAAIRVEYQLGDNLVLHRDVMDLADAGLEAARELLAADTDLQKDHLGELWAQSIALPPFEINGGTISIAEFTDEARRLNVNGLLHRDGNARPMMDRLLDVLNLPPGLADEMTDWIDPNDIPSGLGAESGSYRALDPPYPAKNRPMDHVSELLQLRSMEEDWYWGTTDRPGLRELLGVRPVNDYQVNLNTASREVLASISDDWGMSVATQIVEERQREPFGSTADLRQRVPATDRAFRVDPPDRLIAFGSRLFRVRIIAEKEGYQVTVEALMSRNGKVLTRRYL